jgi:hypothetical protein
MPGQQAREPVAARIEIAEGERLGAAAGRIDLNRGLAGLPG